MPALTISILVLTDHQFWLQDRGDRKRISELIKFLATRFSVDVLYLSEQRLIAKDRYSIQSQYKIRDIASVPYYVACSRIGLLIFWIAYRSLPTWLFTLFQQTVFHFSQAVDVLENTMTTNIESKPTIFSQILIEHIQKRNIYSMILVEYLRLTNVAKKIKELIPQSHLIIDTHDVTYLREKSFQRFGKSTGLNLSKESEARLLDNYDLILGITIDDCIALSDLVNKSVLHVGHPCPSPSNQYLNPSFHSHDGCQILFMGTGGEANVDSVQILITEVMPLLNECCVRPFVFHIAGEVCNEPRIRRLASSNSSSAVIWHGYVPQPSSIYALADIVCNPVRIGGGLKIKNIEAICHHCVLVTTSEGAKGLPSFAEPYFIRADTSRSQASAIASLVNSASLLESYRLKAAQVSKMLHPEHVFRDLETYIKNHSPHHNCFSPLQ